MNLFSYADAANIIFADKNLTKIGRKASNEMLKIKQF